MIRLRAINKAKLRQHFRAMNPINKNFTKRFLATTVLVALSYSASAINIVVNGTFDNNSSG